MTFTRVFLLDLLERAGKSFLQALLVSVGSANLLAALDAAHAGDYSVLQKTLGAAVLAGAYAGASVFTSILSGLKTGTASASATVAQSTPTAPAVLLALPMAEPPAVPPSTLAADVAAIADPASVAAPPPTA
ncbi:hypothetical protein SAMN05892883_2060 [Jatrophihabitans sp. GAS493]|uniref:hypothetical protein n=1 Tax=Jatrophihabitans sp. GAS493 TaxID=1907575 RepID=UPI000BB93CCB|nr:hypothetical protein [Jatrophihabitans sp. GAS493]SOD72709.1 hypothetical protein SAMN05892883_2060 [Jatrophihabitans sp. GAS493]